MMPVDQTLFYGVVLFLICVLLYLWECAESYDAKPRTPRLAFTTFECVVAVWFLGVSALLCEQNNGDHFELLAGYSPVITFVCFRVFSPQLLRHKSGLLVSVIHLMIASVSYLVLTTPQIDQLRGWYTLAHILLAIFSICIFTLSGVSSVIYLMQERALKSKRISSQMLKRTLSLSYLDRMCLRGTLIGFPCYSISMIFGLTQVYVHRQDLHLSHLIAAASWLLFGALLQARLIMGWRGKRAAILNVVAFAGLLVVFIDYGVRAYMRGAV